MLRRIYYKDCKHLQLRQVPNKATKETLDASSCLLKDKCPTCGREETDIHPKLREAGCPSNCTDYKEEN